MPPIVPVDGMEVIVPYNVYKILNNEVIIIPLLKRI